MAKCGHCNHVGTRLEEISPANGQYKMMAICCMACGSILGTTDYLNSGVLLKSAETERAKVKSTIDDIRHVVGQIADALRRR